jgi:hypothetical protein
MRRLLRAENQEPRIEALKALSKPKCKQCGQREMEFTKYRSPWHTKNDIDLLILPWRESRAKRGEGEKA